MLNPREIQRLKAIGYKVNVKLHGFEVWFHRKLITCEVSYTAKDYCEEQGFKIALEHNLARTTNHA